MIQVMATSKPTVFESGCFAKRANSIRFSAAGPLLASVEYGILYHVRIDIRRDPEKALCTN